MLSIETVGWRSGTRSFLVLRADGTYRGLWREGYAFTQLLGYSAIPSGRFDYARGADGFTAELKLRADDGSEPVTKRLRFIDSERGALEQDDSYAIPEVFSLQSLPVDGPVQNTALRCRLQGGESAQVGIVVAGYHRYLLRVVGPSLKRFIESSVVERPELRVFKSGEELDELETGSGLQVPATVLSAVTQLVGAFPLVEDAADQVVLLSLGRGAYVIEAVNPTALEGEVLIEVYPLPF